MVMVGIGWIFGRVRYPWYKGLLSRRSRIKNQRTTKLVLYDVYIYIYMCVYIYI